MAGDVARREFDYDRLPSHEQDALKRHAVAFRTKIRSCAQSICEAGKELLTAADLVDRPTFEAWASHELGISRPSLYRYIAVAKAFSSLNLRQVNVDALALYALASPAVPDRVRSDILKRAGAGEHITLAAVEQHLPKPKALPAAKGGSEQSRPGQGPTPSQAGGSQEPAGTSSAAPAGADDFPEDEDAGPPAAGDEPEFRDLTADTEPGEPDEAAAPSERAVAKRKGLEALGQLVRALDTLGLFVVWRPALEQLQAAIRGASE